MTCIVALKTAEGTFMGGDRAATDENDLAILGRPKVFERGCFLFGCAGDLRVIDLLQFALELPSPGEAGLGYIVSKLVPAIRKCFEENGFSGFYEGKAYAGSGSRCLVGYGGEIYEVGPDFGVFLPSTPYAAIGSGGVNARGAMAMALKHNSWQFTPKGLIREALKIAAAQDAAVSPPFDILSQRRDS